MIKLLALALSFAVVSPAFAAGKVSKRPAAKLQLGGRARAQRVVQSVKRWQRDSAIREAGRMDFAQRLRDFHHGDR